METITPITRPTPARHLSPGVVKSSVFAIVAVLALAFVATMLLDRKAETDAHYSPRGYYDRVAAMLETGALKYSSKGGQPWGSLEYVAENATRSQRAFYENAPRLVGDLRTFNESGGGLFELVTDDDGLRSIGINRFTYNFTLPYPKVLRARPELSFAGEELPSMSNTLVSLRFERRDDDQPIDASDYVRLQADSWLGDPGNRGGTTHRALGYELVGSRGRTLIRLRSLPDGIYLECVSGDVVITINGVSLNEALAADAEDIARLERPEGTPANHYFLHVGDRIHLVEGARETTLRFGHFENARISRNWRSSAFGDDLGGEFATRFPYGAQVASMVRYFAEYSELPGLNLNPRIKLSVDLQLHSGIEDKLTSFVRQHDQDHRRAQPYLPKQPAAVSVIDALNGDVLAVASYPPPAVLDELLERRSGERAFVSASEGRALRLNQNFVHVPVGSTTKPLFACAIWEANPQLMSLEVDEDRNDQHKGGGMVDVLGHTFTRPAFTYLKGLERRHIVPRDFLKRSSNAYTITLYFASMLEPGSYKVSTGRLIPTSGNALSFKHALVGDQLRGGLLERKVPANQILASNFGVLLTRDHRADPGLGYDLKFLQPLLDELGADLCSVPRSFRTVTPRLTNFDLASMESARNELVSLLVGGHTNWWSNLKLAEAIARVGSGKRVELRMFKRKDDPAIRDFEPLALREDVLALVKEGMRGAVLESGGTAVALRTTFEAEAQRRAAEMGLHYEICGKTGTASRQAQGERTTRDCAAFVFYLALKDAAGKEVSARSTAIYLQDRNSSGRAVDLAAKILPDIMRQMEDQAQRR